MNENSKYCVEMKSQDSEKCHEDSIPPGVDSVLNILSKSIDV